MPTTKTVRTTRKASRPASRPSAKALAQCLTDCQKLSDLSTLQHPRGSHEANFELFDARKALASMGSKWTYKQAGEILLLKKMRDAGKFSDFPGMTQQEGELALGNLGDKL